jgi:hypothetical protein
VEDCVFEDRVQALADALQRLSHPGALLHPSGPLVRRNGAERLQQLGRFDVGDGLVPERGRDVVLMRGDPVRAVLASSRRLDDTLVEIACAMGQGPALARFGGFRRGFDFALSLSQSLAGLNGVDALAQLHARLVRRVARACEAVG